MSDHPQPPGWTGDLVGMTEEEAGEHAAAHTATVRVVERDGQPLPMTMDYRPDRVNVVVAAGVVAGVHSMG